MEPVDVSSIENTCNEAGPSGISDNFAVSIICILILLLFYLLRLNLDAIK